MIHVAHTMAEATRYASGVRGIARLSRRRPGDGAPPIDSTLRGVGTIRALYMAHLGVTLGTGVATWADQSGTGDANKNATQGTGANQPTVVAADANFGGRTVLATDGTDYLQTGSWAAANSQPCTRYIVCRQTSAVGVQILNFSNTGANFHYLPLAAGTGNLTANAGTSVVTTTSLLNTTTILCWVINGASSELYFNCITTPTNTGNVGANNSPGDTLCAGNTGANGFIGRYAAQAIYAGAHTAAQRAAVINPLASYYGITVTP